MIEVIAFDGDDTLWHNEHHFLDTQERFRELVRPHIHLEDADLNARLLAVERQNLPLFGYGVKAFTLSLIETAIEITDGRIPGRDLQAVLELGKVLLDHPVDLLEGVREAVDTITDRYRVMVVTKGDLLHQEAKVARSGLAELFWRVEIVSEKDEPTYRRLLDRHNIAPETFMMVGNSVRSDVLPVLAVGGHAVHVPYSVTWALEEAEPDEERPAFPVLESLADLPACIEALNARA